MSLKNIESEFPGYKIWKLEDGRLYLDGIYLSRSETLDLIDWLTENFE